VVRLRRQLLRHFVDVQLSNIGATLVNYDVPNGRTFQCMEAPQICKLPPLETVYIAPPQAQPPS
jgi:hypothetical protein